MTNTYDLILVLGGTEYDTFIDSRVIKSMGKPAGDVSPAWLADEGASGRRVDVSPAPRPWA